MPLRLLHVSSSYAKKTTLRRALAIDSSRCMHIIIDIRGHIHVALAPFIVNSWFLCCRVLATASMQSRGVRHAFKSCTLWLKSVFKNTKSDFKTQISFQNTKSFLNTQNQFSNTNQLSKRKISFVKHKSSSKNRNHVNTS